MGRDVTAICLAPRPRARRGARGHLLVELLSMLPIVGIIGIVVVQFYLASASGIAAIYAQNALQLRLTRVTHDLMTDIREASDVLATNTVVPTFNGTYTCDLDTLCLNWPSVDADDLPVNDVLVYDFVPGTGQMTRILSAVGITRANSQRVETGGLTQATFTAPPPIGTRGSVRCELEASQIERGREYRHALVSQARMRNH